MYERSAIVLERYMENILGSNNKFNLKRNYINYSNLITELEEYQKITTKENKIIEEFDTTVKKIEDIQKKQEKIINIIQKKEEERKILFSDLGEDSHTLESKFEKIEESISKDNEDVTQLRKEFVKLLNNFTQRQKERNKCEKTRRISESNHMGYIKNFIEEFKQINPKDVTNLKKYINEEKEDIQKEIYELMIKNGKNEKVKFNENVIKKAINERINISIKEVQCYIAIYDKTKKILEEIENDNIKLEKFKKVLRDSSVKLTFLEAHKEYVVGFLDYERMTAISGTKLHNKMMQEACKGFDSDIKQIDNLYELVVKEITNKSTKKAYKELYNKTYLINIENKEKNFEKEANNIKINMGTVINTNYWRIEGIKNVYEVFQKEISEKFEKDLSEYKIEDVEDKKQKSKKNNKREQEKYYEEDEDEEYDDEYDDEYDEDDEDYDDEYDEDDEDYDDEYDDEDEDYDEDEDEDEDDEDEWEKEIRKKAKTIKKSKDNKKQGNGIFDRLFKDKKTKNNNK